MLVRPDLPTVSDDDANLEWNSVLFKHERIYQHKIMKISYTTYDVRRDEDIIHVGTSHCNIMLLKPDCSEQEHDRFYYARVLGIFYAYVTYIGEGTSDF